MSNALVGCIVQKQTASCLLLYYHGAAPRSGAIRLLTATATPTHRSESLLAGVTLRTDHRLALFELIDRQASCKVNLAALMFFVLPLNEVECYELDYEHSWTMAHSKAGSLCLSCKEALRKVWDRHPPVGDRQARVHSLRFDLRTAKPYCVIQGPAIRSIKLNGTQDRTRSHMRLERGHASDHVDLHHKSVRRNWSRVLLEQVPYCAYCEPRRYSAVTK